MRTYEQLHMEVDASRGPGAGFRTSMVLAVLIGASFYLSELRPAVLFSTDGFGAAASFLTGLFPPNFSPDFLRLVARATLETVAIGIAGTTLAIVIGTILGPLGSARVMGTRTVTTPIRIFLSFIRSVPDLVWAVFFVRIVGLGPFAGVLAIGVSYGGILSKMYGELLDAAPRAPIEAIAGIGAGRSGQFVYAILPQAWHDLVGYSMYRWECAVRSAALLGIVGAGGLGQEIEISMRMFEYSEVSTIILALILIVIGIDRISAMVRRAS